jgi:hypothetical protein
MTTSNINHFMKYLIHDCYEEDYDPLFAECWYDNHCFSYSFCQWYFLFRKKLARQTKYKLTPSKLFVAVTFIYKQTNKCLCFYNPSLA